MLAVSSSITAEVIWSVASPFLAGFVNGFLHVVLGPDHVAVIVAMSQLREPWQAFQAGVHWAVSHALGLGVMGIVFAIFRSAGSGAQFGEWVEKYGGMVIGSGLVGFGIFFWIKRRWYFDDNWSPISMCRCAEQLGHLTDVFNPSRHLANCAINEPNEKPDTELEVCPVASPPAQSSLNPTATTTASSGGLSFGSSAAAFGARVPSFGSALSGQRALATSSNVRFSTDDSTSTTDTQNAQEVTCFSKFCYSGGIKQMLVTWLIGFLQGLACPAIVISFLFLTQYAAWQLAIFIVSFVALSMGSVSYFFGWFVRRYFRTHRCVKWMFILSCVFSVVIGAVLFICSAAGIDIDPAVVRPEVMAASPESVMAIMPTSFQELEAGVEPFSPVVQQESIFRQLTTHSLVDHKHGGLRHTPSSLDPDPCEASG